MSQDVPNRGFNAPTAMAAPRDGRRVKQLLDGTDLRAVCELIPTTAVTATFPLNGAAYSSIFPLNVPGGDTYQNYILYNIDNEDAHRTSYTKLWFCKSRADQLTAPANTYFTSRMIEWPAILKWVQLLQKADFTYFHRYGLIPSRTTLTTCRVNEYVSTVAPTEDMLIDDSPSPTEVSWYYEGSEMHIPRCLHRTLRFPGYDDQTYVVWNSNQAGLQGSIQQQVFPATDPVSWEEFHDENTVRKVDGLYYWLEVIALVPQLERAILIS